MIRQPLLCTAGLVFLLAACDKSTGPSGSDMTQADANEMAAAMDEIATLGINDFGLGSLFSVTAGEGSAALPAVAIEIDNAFSVRRQCPRGGNVVFAGTTTGTADRATHSLSLHTVATRTDNNCAFPTRRGVITVNGNPNIAFDGQINIVGGQPVGLQTHSQEGSFTWTLNGVTTICDVDVSSSFNPATHTVTVTGTFCNRTIDVTRTRGGR